LYAVGVAEASQRIDALLPSVPTAGIQQRRQLIPPVGFTASCQMTHSFGVLTCHHENCVRPVNFSQVNTAYTITPDATNRSHLLRQYPRHLYLGDADDIRRLGRVGQELGDQIQRALGEDQSVARWRLVGEAIG
jgi:hypothetical protein